MIVSETESGPIRGRPTAYGTVFLGVPYAAGPVGAGRFRAPEPHERWTAVRDATRPGPTAPQPKRDAFGRLDMAPYFGPGWVRGTDYLTVNIWAPPAGDRAVPVMVFVHGGGFVAGSTNASLYDGSAFARDGVILVTVNYRLGIPGWLHLPGAPDNRGLLDVRAALRWVRDNIAGFGGDPGNVTVFGQSAGAVIVGGLLADPASAGLMRRAIVQSGNGLAALTPEQAATVAAGLGGSPTLATVSDEQLVAWLPRLSGRGLRAPLSSITPFSLVLDEQPADTVAAGRGADVDLLIGSNRDEGALYLALRDGTTEVDVHATAALFHADPDEAVRACRALDPGASLAQLRTALLSDGLFGTGTRALADAHAKRGRTWRYEFAWRSTTLGAAHVVELPFVFDRLDVPALHGPSGLLGNGNGGSNSKDGSNSKNGSNSKSGSNSKGGSDSEEPRDLAARMHSAWIRFAATGDPGWPRHPETQRFA
ncbi:carboxylesterase family protein [Actinoplanes bogorensis]|uniref:Carboxylic ester hydrolase n=1 Tax=Paractinoplanes bogorensis TaxID=1610840 RepID=A0ABS5YX78_9ACTN|nr:carboxylesterase family protein [Actinoplanes bogorensis]MBU2668049.1 carboxylesterase family protein [Actinoplanes bogorensis]